MARTLAYLDAGSAGVIVQMIGGGIAALLVAIKVYGRRIVGRLGGKKPVPEPTSEQQGR